MKRNTKFTYSLVAAMLMPFSTLAYESGSDGSDGVLVVDSDVELQLPPDGIFQFVSVQVDVGATLTFTPNAANTPAFLLSQQDIVVDGSIAVDGQKSADVGDANAADDGEGGLGGPGGYAGGRGGSPGPLNAITLVGSRGFGPGGGGGGLQGVNCAGAGGSYSTAGLPSCFGSGIGEIYGSNSLSTLIGGSGGGGSTAAGQTFPGLGGGGGGGSILLAATGEVVINGAVTAVGGAPGTTTASLSGGGGSGGAIRLVATTVSGSGLLDVGGGNGPSGPARGGFGRIRIEADNLLFTSLTSPAFSHDVTSVTFAPNQPQIAITSVAGITAPIAPTGFGDVRIPETISNPVTVEVSTAQVPLDATIELKALPFFGNPVTAASAGIQGTVEAGVAQITISLPTGFSSLIVTATFTVTVAMNNELRPFTNGEDIQYVRVEQFPDGQTTRMLIAQSGNEYEWPYN